MGLAEIRGPRAHLDTTAGPRAVLGSQQPPTRLDAQIDSTPVPQSDALRAEDGSRSVHFGRSRVLVVVSRCARILIAGAFPVSADAIIGYLLSAELIDSPTRQLTN